MHSALLSENGLSHFIAGTGYDFRYQKAGVKVVQDVERALKAGNLQPKEIYSGQQLHTANLAYVDGKNSENFLFGKIFKETDGLITDKANVALLIKFADCTPVVLFDPVNRVQASLHSGWRGTSKRISLHAVDKMVKEFNCKLENILAYVGPSIDQENYEVGSEVYDSFKDFADRDHFLKPREEKYLMSMSGANLSILKEAGIKPDNIDIEKTSTFTSSALHSARAEGKEYQLNGIFTMFKE